MAQVREGTTQECRQEGPSDSDEEVVPVLEVEDEDIVQFSLATPKG